MIYRRIKTINDPLFKSCWDVYCSNFPLQERRDLLEQKRIFDIYCNNADKEDDKFIFNALLKRCDTCTPGEAVIVEDGVNYMLSGIFSYWVFSQVIFGEHLAITRNMQGTGIGKRAVDHLKEFAVSHDKPILLEIEVPEDIITKRREAFYKKLNFKINPYEHFQPCYHRNDEPVEMVIMTWPEIVDIGTYNKFKEEQQEIMPEF